MSETYSVKLYFKDEVRRFLLPKEQTTYKDLESRCRKLAGLGEEVPVQLKYSDPDGDKVGMSSDVELEYALGICEGQLLRLTLESNEKPVAGSQPPWAAGPPVPSGSHQNWRAQHKQAQREQKMAMKDEWRQQRKAFKAAKGHGPPAGPVFEFPNNPGHPYGGPPSFGPTPPQAQLYIPPHAHQHYGHHDHHDLFCPPPSFGRGPPQYGPPPSFGDIHHGYAPIPAVGGFPHPYGPSAQGYPPVTSPGPTQIFPTEASEGYGKPKDLYVRFISHQNYPDDTDVPVGTTFNKTWRLRNAGLKKWPEGTVILRVDRANDLSAPDSVPVTSINPGEETDVTVAMVCPSSAGRYQSYFKLGSPEGKKFGQRIRCQIIAVSQTSVSAERIDKVWEQLEEMGFVSSGDRPNNISALILKENCNVAKVVKALTSKST